jgi:hypothetical protein
MDLTKIVSEYPKRKPENFGELNIIEKHGGTWNN